MLGLMQDRPLALPHVFHRAERYFGHKTIVSTDADGRERCTTVADWAIRVRRLATALDALGVGPDARVGTFCWNSAAHLEIYLGAPCTGRVLHTVNIRLFPEQLTYIVGHAGDEVLFVDRSLLPVLWPHAGEMSGVRHFVVIDDGGDAEIPDDPRILDYEELLAAAEPYPGTFVVDDENRAAAICYTSGTTGNPKGVVYSHRSAVLHSLMVLMADGVGLGERDVVLPIVPMFHANAWGLPFGALLVGSSLVLPGPNTAPAALLRQMAAHRVSVTGAVATVWMNARPLLPEHDLSALRLILCGGSAVPKELSEAYRSAIGVPLLQAWGMTETGPIATLSLNRERHSHLPADQQADVRARAGQPVPLVDLRLADPDTGEEIPWGDPRTGEIEVAGPWVASEYYRGEGGGRQFTDDGWLRTGDIAAIDDDGYLRIVDRTKDLVKSGGEWISSVELEVEIMAHPAVAEAAVIGIPDPVWVERPMACVVLKPGEQLKAADIIEHLTDRVAKWWIPEVVEFIDEVPKTSTGKFSKLTLRQRYATRDAASPEPAQ